MLVTTDRKKALADSGNRGTALNQLKTEISLIGESGSQIEEWVDDIILGWVENHGDDVRRGFQPS